jgi:phenol hydroxylase P4 protein
MTTIAITSAYHGARKDRVENFHGLQLLNIGWDKHLLFAAPMCIPVAPDMPFGALIEKVLPGMFGAHPDFALIDWRQVGWLNSSVSFTPDPGKSLAQNGLGHKAILRFQTPGLPGIHGVVGL